MEHPAPGHGGRPYAHLFGMTVLSFIAMYVLMYAMVNSLAEVHPNINQFYMAGLMAAPHAVFMLGLMKKMFSNKGLNAVVLGVSLIALAAFWFGIRKQAAVSDVQFVKSMIPHHSGAILMCREAALQDAELKALCRQIVENQADEIKQMEAVLERL